MAGAQNEIIQPCDAPDPDTSPISRQRDQPPLQEDDITQRSISAQNLSTQFLEQPYDSVTGHQYEFDDNFDDDSWGLGNMASAAPYTPHTVAPLSTSSCVLYPPSSQSKSVIADGNISQENFTSLSLLPKAYWESYTQSAASDFGQSNLNTTNPPKIGTRFSRESSKLLIKWFEDHYSYPYPSKEETETLQHQTGLSKTQIKNWLANTRRREKMHQSIKSSRKATAEINFDIVSIDMPKRPDTPTVQTRRNHHTMGPLERWVDSPPESEPATVTAIAKAVKSAKSSRSWPLSKSIDDGSGRSINETSDNSYGTSSGSSLASIYSYGSSDSFTGGAALVRSRSRRRRRRLLPRPRRSLMRNKQHPFQCTFCAESFKTKYDWQRHEKTLHIPLERWLCSPDGPRAIDSETGQLVCVFCGISEPNDSHISGHNPNSCQERRFNRKDHLKQHLHLVHKSKLIDAITEGWKTSTTIIRSRCGFCGAHLDSWNDRVEHLADHFKMGKTMDNWTGDWGFEDAITDTLENAIPPYLLGEERNSPFPFEASDISPESPRTAYELLVVELSCFVETHQEKTGQIPGNDAMQLEACRIIFASEISSLEIDTKPSWLRDLVLSNEIITTQAQFLPIRTPSEGRLRTLEIRGKKTLFEECSLEAQLHNFVLTEAMVNQSAISNAILQVEACKILIQMQHSLNLSLSDFVYTWFMALLQSSSTDWLSHFRRRAYLPAAQSSSSPTFPALIGHRTSWTASGAILDPPYIDTNEFDALRIFKEEAINGIGPNNKPLLNEPCLAWHGQMPMSSGAIMLSSSQSFIPSKAPLLDEELFTRRRLSSGVAANPVSEASRRSFPLTQADGLQMGSYRLHDPNFYKWLGRELGRWVTSIMSPNNPNCHIPSDKEIQHHARFLMYDDDDPWNQTVADNSEWLHRFKVGVGIVTE
ncbi:hypothetical protein M441DRAFT_70163 [Trichoderma asperellum CBS 433.97]|uniref:Homeobox domain-containing protein n=2 Tax=Trichoderma asperellum TaxID=101201 RepID=A0A2T3Z6B3_TRIA4|nr:hypothetical protein M441DRAFT_70163 [Trichoderma asperellum CBS 433.97]PTB40335.1 hypothetical protein M441DRAFT_70163 [Trichoderma asperellum CBS 433.97]